MATNIKCPSCNFEFPLEEALNDELKESIEKEKNELRHQMIDFKKTKEEELKKAEQIFQKQLQQKEEELNTRVTAEKQKIQQELQESLKKALLPILKIE
jgi:thiol-disulfide isomerase/thioredoxin